MSDFYVHIRNVFTIPNEWLLGTYKKRIHITNWASFMYIKETYSHYGMSDCYVHIRNVSTSRNEWLLGTYQKRINITEWVTLMYI